MKHAFQIWIPRQSCVYYRDFGLKSKYIKILLSGKIRDNLDSYRYFLTLFHGQNKETMKLVLYF